MVDQGGLYSHLRGKDLRYILYSNLREKDLRYIFYSHIVLTFKGKRSKVQGPWINKGGEKTPV